MVVFSLENLPYSSLFRFPRHAGGYIHLAKAQSGRMFCLVRQVGGDVVLCAIGRRHHPNFAVTCDQAMAPSQDAPSGQGAHL